MRARATRVLAISGTRGDHFDRDAQRAIRRLYPEGIVTYVAADGFDDLEQRLSRLPPGQFDRIELFGHGSAGTFSVGEDTLSVYTSGKLKRISALKLGAPGAEVRVIACSVGRGEKGERFLRYLGESFLGEGGGKVLAATRTVGALHPTLAFALRAPTAGAVAELAVLAKEMFQSGLRPQPGDFAEVVVPARASESARALGGDSCAARKLQTITRELVPSTLER